MLLESLALSLRLEGLKGILASTSKLRNTFYEITKLWSLLASSSCILSLGASARCLTARATSAYLLTLLPWSLSFKFV